MDTGIWWHVKTVVSSALKSKILTTAATCKLLPPFFKGGQVNSADAVAPLISVVI